MVILYYIVFGILYAFSLLPLRVLYVFSDLAAFILHRVTKYRRDVILGNLAIAFPEKTQAERETIARKFYINFTDTFIESIKLLSISKNQIEERSFCDFSLIEDLIAKGKNIHILAGHQFNWEFGNLGFSMHLKAAPFIAVYMPVNNRIFDRIFFGLRKRYGTVLVSVKEFRNKMHSLFATQYMLVLAADQNPGIPANAYWLEFFGKPAPFVTGPGKGAVKNNTAVVFVGFKKVKRGHYRFEILPIAENGADHTPVELTLKYKQLLEEVIRRDPSNYLWSHRRWRHEWKEGYPPILRDKNP